MTPEALGRDPFSKPAAEPDKTKPKAKPKAKKARAPKKAARPATRSKAPKAKRAAARTPPPPSPVQTAPSKAQTRRARDVAAEIDRQELLGGLGRQDNPLIKLFYELTRFLRPSTYGTKLGEMGMHFHADEVGPFGFDPRFWKAVEPFFDFLYDKYWRIEISGLENIPEQGRALLVANHSGSLPYDGIMLRMAIERNSTTKRQVRFLVEDFIFHFPFLGSFVNRVGGVRACQDNATRLLAGDRLVGVFPEGVKGIGKLYRKRYQLQRFGRGGFVKLALRSQSPILPVAVVGAEEIHPMLTKLTWLARSLGLPYVPVTPTFPWLGPLGLLPLPSKWKIRIGEPITFEPTPDRGADAQLRLMDKVEMVRGRIQQMIEDLLHERKHPFLGD